MVRWQQRQGSSHRALTAERHAFPDVGGDSVAGPSDPRDETVEFIVDVKGPVLHVAFRGELDMACAERFDCLFDLRTEGIDTVVLDLCALTFCDLSGVNALTGLRSFHRCHGRTAEFTNVRPPVRRLMDLAERQVRPAPGGAAPA